MMGSTRFNSNYDVVILGAGLAGLTLARQLLLQSQKSVLLLEKRSQIPPTRQKVGEATVQVSAYYLSKVLDLEEHLLRDHLMKYNLRFYWKTPGQKNDAFEHYSQSYIRSLSNIATYQLDRNKIEHELLRLNSENPKFQFCAGALNIDAQLSGSKGPHRVAFECEGERIGITADWLVDATGRAKFLSRRLGLVKPSPIRHGSIFFWVDGLVNIEKLTELPDQQRLKHPSRRMIGHLPFWLATNHFCGEGYWFWVIPLQGKTSLGLVYDKEKIPEAAVSSPEKAIEWICRDFPLFARDLPKRKIVDHGMVRDFAYDCRQTISAERWALSGEAGRFTDPLYSPGGDLIALYNTLITDAILTDSGNTLAIKSRIYEMLMWAFYEAYVPSYAVSYDVLGDQESYTLKYAWELTIYFTFYVFPFVNQLFTDVAFVIPYLDLFAKLGMLNQKVQTFITEYYRWKKGRSVQCRDPRFCDFTSFGPLVKAQELIYQIGLSPGESIRLLRQHIANIEELARFIAAYIYSVVLGDESLLKNEQLYARIRMEELQFDPAHMHRICSDLDRARAGRVSSLAPDFVRQFSEREETLTQPANMGCATPLPIATHESDQRTTVQTESAKEVQIQQG
jgi:2-polyprenyl-6-methoxyphenol hydroxylase-like FAD-dependent oxidoreductase